MLTSEIKRAGLAALLLTPACAPAELSHAGTLVAVSAAPAAGCTRIAELSASAGYNGRGAEANEAGVEAQLRNDAALRGGDAIVIRERRHGAAPVDALSQSPGATQSGGCPNCVAMRADVYRCRARAAAPAASAAAPASTAPSAAAPAASASAAPSTPAAPGADRFAVTSDAALGAVAASARACLGPDGPRGEALLRVTFAPTGDVVYAEVEGAPFAGTSAGACIAAKARNAHVPAFTGDPRTLTRTLKLAP